MPITVHDDVVEVHADLQFVRHAAHPCGVALGRLGVAAEQSRSELGLVPWRDVDEHRLRHAPPDARGTLHVGLDQNVLAPSQCLRDLRQRTSVVVAVDDRPLKKPARLPDAAESCLVDKVVVDAVALGCPGRPGRHRDYVVQVQVMRLQKSEYRVLARSGRPGHYEQDGLALGNDAGGPLAIQPGNPVRHLLQVLRLRAWFALGARVARVANTISDCLWTQRRENDGAGVEDKHGLGLVTTSGVDRQLTLGGVTHQASNRSGFRRDNSQKPVQRHHVPEADVDQRDIHHQASVSIVMLQSESAVPPRGLILALDSITVAAIADELARALVGGRVQKVARAEDSTYGLEVYVPGHRHQLALVARQDEPCAYLSSGRVGSGELTPSPILLLMRKHLLGARVMSFVQHGVERVVTLTFGFPSSDVNPAPDRLGSHLVLELIPRFGNLVLTTEAGLILDCEHRVASGPDRIRTLLPRQQYQPPPALGRLTILDVVADDIEAALAGVPLGQVHRALTSAFAGVSPALAKEAVRRAQSSGDPSARGIALALSGLADLWRRRAWQPGVAEADGAVVAAAPYRLTGIGTWRATPSTSVALELSTNRQRRQRPVDIARRAALASLAKRRRAATAKLDSLRRALHAGERAEQLRLDGETVLAHAHTIARGQDRLVADGREVQLDPALSASANAQGLFKRYRKAKAALANVPRLIEETERQIDYLDAQAALIAAAESAEDVRAIAREATQAFRRQSATERQSRRARPLGHLGAPIRVVAPDGTEILVGRSAKQNEQVTFEIGSPDDVWLHARGIPGAHVIIRCGSREPSPETLSLAATLAAKHSASAGDSVVAVDWTRRRHVRRVAGYPGLVTYRDETVVRVSPDSASISRR